MTGCPGGKKDAGSQAAWRRGSGRASPVPFLSGVSLLAPLAGGVVFIIRSVLLRAWWREVQGEVRGDVQTSQKCH